MSVSTPRVALVVAKLVFACRARLLIAGFVAPLTLAACDWWDNDKKTDPIDPMAQAMHASALSRDPTQFPPNFFEQMLLEQSEFSALSQLSAIPGASLITTTPTLSLLRQRASIAGSVPTYIIDDLRRLSCCALVGGGFAYHSFIVYDGKLLDIMSEYANYIAMQQLGQTSDPLVFAVDTIVLWHNSGLGSLPEARYPLALLTPQARTLSDRHFATLMGAIVFHEFGHYYLYHMLDHLRALGTPVQAVVDYTTQNEDDADRIAGMLTAKAGHDLAVAQQMIDLMAFYIFQRINPIAFTSFASIVGSLPMQFQQNGVQHSSLAVRKQLIAEGFARYKAVP